MKLKLPTLTALLAATVIAAGAQTFLEIGPKNVLAGLLKRIDKEKVAINLDTVEAFNAFLVQN